MRKGVDICCICGHKLGVCIKVMMCISCFSSSVLSVNQQAFGIHNVGCQVSINMMIAV